MRGFHALKRNKNTASSGISPSVNRLKMRWGAYETRVKMVEKAEFTQSQYVFWSDLLTPYRAASVAFQRPTSRPRSALRTNIVRNPNRKCCYTVLLDCSWHYLTFARRNSPRVARPDCTLPLWLLLSLTIILLAHIALLVGTLLAFIYELPLVIPHISVWLLRRFPNSLIPPERVFLLLFCVVEALNIAGTLKRNKIRRHLVWDYLSIA